MKLIPYFLRKRNQNTFCLETLNVFLAHAGKAVWTTEEQGLLSLDTILHDYCEANGLIVNQVFLEKDVAFLEVNPEKTNLSEFYTWEEALAKPGKPECWRRFYFLQDKEGSDWWSPKGLVEAEIQGFGNVQDLHRHLRTYYKV
jgi:hypothetical protein